MEPTRHTEEPILQAADHLSDEQKRAVRRINATYKVGGTLAVTGLVTAFAFDLGGSWADPIVAAGVVAFIIGGVTILVWGAMSRRFKKKLER
jgi:Flp pilus assembly protein TadB